MGGAILFPSENHQQNLLKTLPILVGCNHKCRGNPLHSSSALANSGLAASYTEDNPRTKKKRAMKNAKIN
jgi:hypothetical protein